MTRRALIVDGYNLICHGGPYRERADRDDIDAARSALVGDIAAYVGGETDATVVFDGASNELSTGEPHSVLGVTVIFSPFGVSADSVIESLARRARDRGIPVDVVTSDAQTQWAVMGGSVTRRSSGEFVRELSREDEERAAHAETGTGRVPLADRVPDDVRATLERWARGKP